MRCVLAGLLLVAACSPGGESDGAPVGVAPSSARLWTPLMGLRHLTVDEDVGMRCRIHEREEWVDVSESETLWELTDDGLPLREAVHTDRADATHRWVRYRDEGGEIVHVTVLQNERVQREEMYEDGRLTDDGYRQYTWDADGRLATRTHSDSDGTTVETWSWDDAGRMTGRATTYTRGPDFDDWWTWSDEGWLLDAGWTGDGGVSITFTDHDDAGHPTGARLDDSMNGRSQLVYAWDAKGRFDGYRQRFGPAYAVTERWGRRARPDGGSDAEVVRWVDKSTGREWLGPERWTYDAAGRPTSWTDGNEQELWRWDDDGTLREVAHDDGPGMWVESATYEGECPPGLWEQWVPEPEGTGWEPDPSHLPDPTGSLL